MCRRDLLASLFVVAACADPSTSTSTAPLTPVVPVASQRAHVITGTITDGAGNPLAGAAVEYSASFDVFVGDDVKVDSAGRYVLALPSYWRYVEVVAFDLDPGWDVQFVALRLDTQPDTIRIDFTLRPQ